MPEQPIPDVRKSVTVPASVEECFKAFNHNTWFGAAVFVGVFLALT